MRIHRVWTSFPVLLIVFCTVSKADRLAFTHEDAAQDDSGALARLSTETFSTTNIRAYRLSKTSHDESESFPNSHLFFAPRGDNAPTAGPTILNNDGHLVWFAEGFPNTHNFRPQVYRREQYLTWWHGDDSENYGKGTYYMYDKHYRPFKTISAHGNYHSDAHDFLITKDNTALLTVYDDVQKNLSDLCGLPGGRLRYYLFQEIDIETNALLFEWRASDHAGFDDIHESCKMVNITGGQTAWDCFGLSSIDKDNKGNYLISAEHLHALMYIDGATGEIIWQLGGKKNSFMDLSEGRATDFNGQQHASWQDNYHAITVLDKPDHGSLARALKIRIDQGVMTAELVAEPITLYTAVSQSQDSMQHLENGDLFIEYGIDGHRAEFIPDGSRFVSEWQTGSSSPVSARSPAGRMMQNYRACKRDWEGEPFDLPAIAFDKGRMSIIWDGATLHREWILEGTTVDEDDRRATWGEINRVARTGYETDIEFETPYDYYRLTALDAQEQPMGVWIVRPSGLVTPIPYTTTPPTSYLPYILYTTALIALFFTISTSFLYERARMRSGSGSPAPPPLLPRFTDTFITRPSPLSWLGFGRRKSGQQQSVGEEGGPEAEQEMALLSARKDVEDEDDGDRAGEKEVEKGKGKGNGDPGEGSWRDVRITA